MGLEKRKYSMNDMKEQDLKSAPSLDLPALKVEKFFLPKDGGKLMLFFANVRKDWRPADGCPYCHRQNTLTLSGRSKPRIIRDVVRNNHCVLIVTQSPRMACNDCHQRFIPKIDGIVENGTMTERLLEFVKTESFLQPHITLCERTGLSIQTIQNIMDGEIDRYEQLRAEHPLDAPEVLGIDEKHIQNVMRGTLVDVKNGNLLDMLEDNNDSTMIEAIKKLKNWDTNIRVVTTDMSNRYIKWLPGLLPKATIVVDKFHVVQDVQKKIGTTKNALYAYRKGIIENIDDDEERIRQSEILAIVNDNRRLFNFSMENIIRSKDGKRVIQLSTLMEAFPEFRLLRMMYSYIEDMYTKETREEAEQIWDEWQKLLPPVSTKSKAYQEWGDLYSVNPQCFDAFRTLSSPGFTQYKPYILNYFNPGCRYTNAATEGLNNLIGSINISGNGYRFRHLRAKALYASLLNERVTYSLDIKTVEKWTPTMNYQGPFSSGNGNGSKSVTTTKYSFRKRTKSGGVDPTNVLTENEDLPKILDSALVPQPDPLPDIDEEETVDSAWKVFQPDHKMRVVEQLLAEADEEDTEEDDE